MLAQFDLERTTAGPSSSPELLVTAKVTGAEKSGQSWEAVRSNGILDDVYYTLDVVRGNETLKVHVIRDLTALPYQDTKGRYVDKAELLKQFCDSLCEPIANSNT